MIDSTNYKIFTELTDIQTNYEGSSLEKIDGLYRSQYKVIKMCEYYSDSRYLGSNYGNKRAIGAGSIDVPFYNIVNYRVALARTATDIDIKDIQINSDNPDAQTEAMILNREAFEWMKDSEFSRVLNEMGLTRPKYGGYLIKKTFNEEKELRIEVVKWTNVWTDQNDILGGAIVECHHMSPVAIKKKDGVWSDVTDVLKAWKKIKAADRPTTIDVYEVTGEFPIEVYNDAEGIESTDEDKYTYSLQHYFVANVDGKKYKLFCEELSGEMTDYYEYLTWEDNGYGLGRGVIEDSEEAQVWTNDAVINESIAMALAGRVGIKTTSKKVGNNILEHDHGKIYELETGADMNSFNLAPSALAEYQNQINKWKEQTDNTAGSVNAMTGNVSAGNRNYSLQALMHQVAMKHFDYFRAEWGIHLTKIFDNWIIPYLIKKINKEHILVSEFSTKELELIDKDFATFQTNEQMKPDILAGNPVSQEQQAGLTEGYTQHIKKNGKKRFIEVPKDYFTDVECKVTVITTGEQKDVQATLQALNDLMKSIITSMNPATGQFAALQDPKLVEIVNEIIELSHTGVTPVTPSQGQSVSPQVGIPSGAPNDVNPNTGGTPSPTSMLPGALTMK